MPELGTAVLFSLRLTDGVGAVLRSTFICDGENPLALDAESFGHFPPMIDCTNFPELADNPSRVLERLKGILAAITDLQPLAVAAGASMNRCFDIYKLASMTKGANWLTVQQLQFRDKSDRATAVFDSTFRPLLTWADKTRAALQSRKVLSQ